MACDNDQNVLKQGNVISINLKDVHSEYNLLGFHNNKSVFEYTDEKLNTELQQMTETNLKKRVDSTIVPKKIIVKSIQSSGRIVLINDKKVVPVKKCTYVPINTLKMITDNNYATVGNLTKVNTTNCGFLTLTKGTRTYEKKKDKTYQNANTDNRISKVNMDLKACNMIKKIGDKCTSDNIVLEVGKIETPTECKVIDREKEVRVDCISRKLKVVPTKKITYLKNAIDHCKAIDHADKRDSKEDVIPKTSVNTQSKCVKTYCKKNPALDKNDPSLLNTIQTCNTIDLTSDTSNEAKNICEDIELLGTVVTLTESDTCKEDEIVKINVKKSIWDPKDKLNLGCADMGKIKHFKEKSLTEKKSTPNLKSPPDAVSNTKNRSTTVDSNEANVNKYPKKMTIGNVQNSGMEGAVPVTRNINVRLCSPQNERTWSGVVAKKIVDDHDENVPIRKDLSPKSATNESKIRVARLATSSSPILMAESQMADPLDCVATACENSKYSKKLYKAIPSSPKSATNESTIRIAQLPTSRVIAEPEMAVPVYSVDITCENSKDNKKVYKASPFSPKSVTNESKIRITQLPTSKVMAEAEMVDPVYSVDITCENSKGNKKVYKAFPFSPKSATQSKTRIAQLPTSKVMAEAEMADPLYCGDTTCENRKGNKKVYKAFPSPKSATNESKIRIAQLPTTIVIDEPEMADPLYCGDTTCENSKDNKKSYKAFPSSPKSAINESRIRIAQLPTSSSPMGRIEAQMADSIESDGTTCENGKYIRKPYKTFPFKIKSLHKKCDEFSKAQRNVTENTDATITPSSNKEMNEIMAVDQISTPNRDRTKSTKVTDSTKEEVSDDDETSVSNATSNLNVNDDSLSQRVKNRRQQRAKKVNKQISLRREIEKIIKVTMGPRKKQKTKNPEEKSFKHNSCQTTPAAELSDNSTQTESVELPQYQQWTPIEPDTVDTNNLDVILEEHLECKNNIIIGENANFGVGPRIQPYVASSGGSVTFTAGNNLNGIMSDNMHIFPSQLLDTAMGYMNVNSVIGADGANVAVPQKQLFFEYLRNCCQQDAAGNLPLHLGVLSNNLTEVRRQALMLNLRNYSIDLSNNNDLTPLHLAIIHDCDEAIIRFLLEARADLSCTDSDGNTPMHLAVYHNSLTSLKVLLQKANDSRFNLNTFNYEGFTPLLLATIEDKFDMVELILSYGADANVTDQKSGRTPLFHAVENNNLKMVELLLDSGANKKIKNFSGTSTHDAIFELEQINPEIKNKIIGRDLFTINSVRTDKRKRNTEKGKDDMCTKKLKTVKTYRKIKDMYKN